MQSKETIYTIPVNDAFASDHPCPLCDLYAGLEANLEEYYLGPALMESDVRQTTNEHGFCSDHLRALYNSQLNRLGLGLTLHTHLLHLRRTLGVELSKQKTDSRGFMARLRNKEDSPGRNLAKSIQDRADDCVICRRMEQTMERYLDVIFYQYFEERGFREKFHKDKLFCLDHLALMIGKAEKYLRGNRVDEFVETLISNQLAAWDVLAEDVEWFTKKFDYRYKNEPWKNSKDAISRSILFLGSNPELEGIGFGRMKEMSEAENE